MTKRTNWQLLADARRELRDYYKILAPRYGETPDMVDMAPDRIVVVLSGVRMVDVRGGMKITHKGLRWYTFAKTAGKWAMVGEPVEVMNELSTPEFHMSFGVVTADEREAKQDWEDMCHRPGTSSNPMDNLPRQRQGYYDK